MVRNGLRTIVLVGVGLSMMPGCIAWEIRDELKKTNTQLETRLALLDTTNDLLASISTDLGRTKEELAEVKSALGTTNTEMADIETRLAVLEPIQKSLESLDDSLKTVKGLIEKIPFVGASDEKKEGEAASPAPDGEPGAETKPK